MDPDALIYEDGFYVYDEDAYDEDAYAREAVDSASVLADQWIQYEPNRAADLA